MIAWRTFARNASAPRRREAPRILAAASLVLGLLVLTDTVQLWMAFAVTLSKWA
jgi:hypothetical protein